MFKRLQKSDKLLCLVFIDFNDQFHNNFILLQVNYTYHQNFFSDRLHMYRQIMNTFGGFHDGLADGRVGVNYAA